MCTCIDIFTRAYIDTQSRRLAGLMLRLLDKETVSRRRTRRVGLMVGVGCPRLAFVVGLAGGLPGQIGTFFCAP